MARVITSGMERFYSHDFRTMNQFWQPDGTAIIVLQKDGVPLQVLHVENLTEDGEKLLSSQDITDLKILGSPLKVNIPDAIVKLAKDATAKVKVQQCQQL